jgi:hypothetical protein
MREISLYFPAEQGKGETERSSLMTAPTARRPKKRNNINGA